MLISYKHKFIFIHNYKVAGNSVNQALRYHSILNPTRYTVLNRQLEKMGPLGWKTIQLFRKTGLLHCADEHITAHEAKRHIPSTLWDNFFKFGFVRNPWDWQVSLYHYILQYPYHRLYDKINACTNFEVYIMSGTFKTGHLSQYEFFTDSNGNLLVDYIGKLETIQEDFKKIGGVIGLEMVANHVNPSKHKNYREYYNDEMIKIVADHYKRDIELFKYDF